MEHALQVFRVGGGRRPGPRPSVIRGPALDSDVDPDVVQK